MFVSVDYMQENTPTITKQRVNVEDGPVETVVAEGDMKVTVERELVSQAEEEDMEALLGTYVIISPVSNQFSLTFLSVLYLKTDNVLFNNQFLAPFCKLCPKCKLQTVNLL